MARAGVTPPVAAIVGPTASGKTALALELARRLGGEIVSADSRQMYRRLDAGTGKPPGAWGRRPDVGRVYLCDSIPYHLVDCVEPSERVDAARYAREARACIDAIGARGRRPIVAGGTGLYVKAALEGLDPLPPKSAEIRESLTELVEANGREWLHEELSRVDPEAARRIPPGNLRRVARALEVFKLTGKPISAHWTSPKDAAGGTVYIGLSWERAALSARIERRCAEMFPAILDEVRRLVPAEFTGREPGFESLGYPEALAVSRGEASEDRALASFVRSTLAYAKRQATWFRRQAAVAWIPAGDGDAARLADEAMKLAPSMLASPRGRLAT